MRAVVLICLAVLAIAPHRVANGQPAGGCAGVVQLLNNAASLIQGNATAYWAHRQNFVDLIFGPSRLTVPNAMQVAEQEKGQADPLKAGTPAMLANLKNLIAAVQSQGCLSPAQLSAIAEPIIKFAKRVNFDQFPTEMPVEGSVVQTPPLMPRK